MARQGYDLQLTRYDERGWRATFYTTGMEHSPTSATGTGWERTPWRARRCMGASIRVALVVWAGALLLRLPHGRYIMKSVEANRRRQRR